MAILWLEKALSHSSTEPDKQIALPIKEKRVVEYLQSCHNHLHLLLDLCYCYYICQAIQLNNKNKQKTGCQNSKKHLNQKEWQRVDSRQKRRRTPAKCIHGDLQDSSVNFK